MTAQEHFDGQTVSERTTFDAVTHALNGGKLGVEVRIGPDGDEVGAADGTLAMLFRLKELRRIDEPD